MPRAATRFHGREVREILLLRRVSFQNPPSNYCFEKKTEDTYIRLYRFIYVEMYRVRSWRRGRRRKVEGGGSPRGGDDRKDKIGRYCRRSGDTDARPARYHHYHRRGGIERHSKSCDYATKRTPESSIEVQHFGLPILSVSEPSPPDENDRVDDYL